MYHTTAPLASIKNEMPFLFLLNCAFHFYSPCIQKISGRVQKNQQVTKLREIVLKIEK
jgi:hypothetical protein